MRQLFDLGRFRADGHRGYFSYPIGQPGERLCAGSSSWKSESDCGATRALHVLRLQLRIASARRSHRISKWTFTTANSSNDATNQVINKPHDTPNRRS